MAAKIHDYNPPGDRHLFVFHCPGCDYDHPFHVGYSPDRPDWKWNGDMERPTFTPSLVVFKDDPAKRCHCFVTDGRIQFLDDCHHALKGTTVELPDWDT